MRAALAIGALVAATATHCTDASDDDDATGDVGGGAGEAGNGGASGTNAGTGGRGGTSAGAGSANGGAGATAGGEGGTGPMAGEGGVPSAGQGSGGMIEVQFFSVASFDGYLKPPPPVCTTGFIDFGCDGDGEGGASGSSVPLDCDVPNEVISFDADDGKHCPFCAPPGPDDQERDCSSVSEDYGDFLSDIVSASCANYCDTDAQCFAFEIVNACGDFVISLYGLIDEEPIAFAEEYATTHCGVCGATPQRIFMRRSNSDVIEGGVPDRAFLEHFVPRCLERRCVLARLEH